MDSLYAIQPVWLGIGISLSAGYCSLLQSTCSDSYLLIKTLHANRTSENCCGISTQRTIIYNQHSSFYLRIPESTIIVIEMISTRKYMHRWSIQSIHVHTYARQDLKKKKKKHKTYACSLLWVFHLIGFGLVLHNG